MDPDAGSTIKTTGSVDVDDSSDSSSTSSGSDTALTHDDPEAAKAALRAKIRLQAGSLLSSKGPPVATVKTGTSSAAKRSASRNVPTSAVVGGAAAVGAGAAIAAASNNSDEDSLSFRQKTGEQSQENSPPEDAKVGSDDSMNDSKRSVVRFEGEEMDDLDKDDDIKEAPPVVTVPKTAEENAARSAAPRPSLMEHKSENPPDHDEEGGLKMDDLMDVSEEVGCSDGANTGIALCVLFLLIWIIAVPIALTNSKAIETGEDGEPAPTRAPTEAPINLINLPTVAPVAPTRVPTVAPTEEPTATPSLLLVFPSYTEEALTDPESPQSQALQWLFTDPLEYIVLELNDNNLDGEIPPEIAMLASLQRIQLQENKIVGSIPTTMAELSEMTLLDLQENFLTGPIPSELGLMTALNHIWLNGTRDATAEGTNASSIPSELALLTELEQLHLGSNKLSGNVPTELALLQNLDWLTLRNNELSGIIPSEIGLLRSISWLDLAENDLVGNIPGSVGLLNDTLRILQLEDNGLTGNLPFEMNRLTSVQQVWLQHNMLTGNVPAGLCYFKRIGKVETIWVDCEEVACDCNCMCSTVTEEDGEMGEAENGDGSEEGEDDIASAPAMVEGTNATDGRAL
ncbi:leucine Rich Repeat [Seminavis robusta]|uniref:Leucine Rich Repeat n=1 Tax=Seminavis robusta TaxID=568900 RepID=A0A9N8D9M6_9STRA|nr:leucine Rich Repeat [Seminavis robusta]|eukprot:Sro9_g007500.1 leucine Rich Repeat (628) ;mRNA; f:167469-169520